MLIEIIIAAVIGYLVGSIPFAFIFGKLKGKDLRKIGDKNIGTTNLFKNVSKGLGLVSGLLDVLKGMIPMAIFFYLFGSVEIGYVFAGIFAVVGHMKPVFLRFKGGKGLATGLGVFFWMVPFWVFIIPLGFWAILSFTLKKIKKELWYKIYWSLPFFSLLAEKDTTLLIGLFIMTGLIYFLNLVLARK